MAALAAVRRWGGVLEHPAWSLAWAAHALQVPAARGWMRDWIRDEWVCEVSQRAYGHRAEKLTWLLYKGELAPPVLDWTRPEPEAVVSFCSKRGDGSWYRPTKAGGRKRVRGAEASATTVAFRDVLLAMARSVRVMAEDA